MTIKFIDLFAGIGGFHQAFKNFDAKCVFASEIDKYARQTYVANHTIENNFFNEDIRTISSDNIPNHDILCAGFPCQPFSQAGYKKGFKDGENSERGNLFYCILDIIQSKRPKAFILENVKHLLNHDNGNTFNIIYNHLIQAGYSVNFKILKASEFGKPQHRPRLYIVGFNLELINTAVPFIFPLPIPLIQSMSDIFLGKCNKKIGYTLRVGGRGSKIDDRHNWDSYLVNDKVVKLNSIQAKRMMGFDEDFLFPVSETQAMKQLGNSVCVDVIQYLAKEVIEYININQSLKDKNTIINKSFNKGEWSEIYAFFKLIIEQELNFGDIYGNQIINDKVTILSLSHNLSNNVFDIVQNGKIIIKNKQDTIINEYNIKDILTVEKLHHIFNCIKLSNGSSFALPEINEILDNLSINQFKGSSKDKGDINISFRQNNIIFHNQHLGIKSYIGNPPTLLNASSATNFIYEILEFNHNINIDNINIIDSKSKIKDRIQCIENYGGKLKFIKYENILHEQNLRKVDSSMPEIISEILLKYYKGEANKISDLIIDKQKICRFKDYLKAVMLGMFYTKEWNGEYTSQGAIIVKKQGELILYHVTNENVLKDYLFNKTKLDTPSSTRHRFGLIYKENGKFFIKLNLQIRSI